MKYGDEKEEKEYKEELVMKKAVKPEEKKKKSKYKVLVVTPEFVIYSDNGNGVRTKNTWKDLKIGDEISL